MCPYNDHAEQNAAPYYFSSGVAGDLAIETSQHDELDLLCTCSDGLKAEVDKRTGACTCTTELVLPSTHANEHVRRKLDERSRPSQRARLRARHRIESRCPSSYTACPLSNGYECIDTSNDLEQCGGCSGYGTDCTALEGVYAVGCVRGRCEIWACEEGYKYEPRRRECQRRA
ncbi:hypothetical protein JCM10908_001309 [Rhodotorula pacifica]|uniref:uncharacterized protein n=1 Tax=Rhodotorula pacifica TaxID=1495444 RepID=UPI00317808EC